MKQEGSTSTPNPNKPGDTSSRREGSKNSKETPKSLDFSKLDLTIDRVDERLSPSETNIVDK